MPRATRTRAEVELQERDLAILQALFESRLMTLPHITHLFFDGHGEAAKKRIQQLKAHRYIRERERRVYQPSILHLLRRAFTTLSERGMLSDDPQFAWKQLEDRAKVSELTLKHEIQVGDVKTAFSRAIKSTGHYKLIEFSTWPLLYQFRAPQPPLPGTYHSGSVLIKPDGFVRLHEHGADGDHFEHFFFLEVDRSTEHHETLARRVYGYQDFYRRGGLAVRHGFTPDDFKDFPFRVLIVLRNEERRNNMAERLLQNDPPVLTMVWLTTFPEINADPLGEIWMRSRDYLEITKDTQYDPSRPRTGAYRRDPAREGWWREDSRRAVFVIFSRRHKIAGSKNWTAPPDVLVEAGFALALRHEVFGFLEEGVDQRQQGLLRLCTTIYPRYDKNDLESKRDRYEEYIQKAAQKLGDQSPYSYDYAHLMKEVTVYRDGYGVVRTQYTLKFYNDTPRIIEEHTLSGGASATKGYSLPHLNEMLTNGPEVRKDLEYLFATSIIDGPADTITSSEIRHSAETRDFNIILDGTFTRSSPLLLYEWSWGAPRLFPASAEDLAPGKRVQDLEDVQSEFRVPPSLGAGVTFVLRFEKPISFTKEPVFRVFGQGAVMAAEKTREALLVQRSSIYIVYVCRSASIPYGQVIAQWRPK